jgi:hypothetical protein
MVRLRGNADRSLVRFQVEEIEQVFARLDLSLNSAHVVVVIRDLTVRGRDQHAHRLVPSYSPFLVFAPAERLKVWLMEVVFWRAAVCVAPWGAFG